MQPITPTQVPSMDSTDTQGPFMAANIPMPITPTQVPSMDSTLTSPNSALSVSTKYDFMDEDIFHKKIEMCVDSEIDDKINVYFCMYSITTPFFVEGPSVPIDETTNIYGRILPKYDMYYPCLQWLVQKTDDTNANANANSNSKYQFPKITYDCVSIAYSEQDTDANEDDDTSMETIQFENTVHEYFLSMFSGDVLRQNTNILKTAYKGYYSPNTSDSESNLTKSVYVIYDFSQLYPFLVLNENIRVIINSEISENNKSSSFSPEIVHFFRENHFLTRIKDVISPTIGYPCVYNESEKKWVNISSKDADSINYMLPYEHPLLGCNAYYLSKTPLEPNTSGENLVKMACLEIRIMYEISINEKNEIFYMGDNVDDFKYDFQMGLLMATTFHFREKEHDFIGIKNVSHMHRIFPISKSSTSAHITNSISHAFDKA